MYVYRSDEAGRESVIEPAVVGVAISEDSFGADSVIEPAVAVTTVDPMLPVGAVTSIVSKPAVDVCSSLAVEFGADSVNDPTAARLAVRWSPDDSVIEGTVVMATAAPTELGAASVIDADVAV